MKTIVTVTILMVFISFSTAFTSDNPFVSKKAEKEIEKPVNYPFLVQQVLNKINVFQRKINHEMSQLTLKIRDDHSKKALFTILLLAFIYGIIHAVGPGHGKMIIFSYFLSKEAKLKEGVIAGNLIAFTHGSSALIVVSIVYWITKGQYLNSLENSSSIIKLMSYGLITLIGLYLFIKVLFDLKMKNDHHNHSKPVNPGDTKSIIPISIAAGMVPCPGTTAMLLFSITMEIFKVGVFSAIFISLGMGITISSIGIITIVAKQRVLKFFSNKIITIFQTATGLIGSLLILILGTFLLIGTL